MEKLNVPNGKPNLYKVSQFAGKARIIFQSSGVGNAPLDIEIMHLSPKGRIKSEFVQSYDKNEIQQLIQFLNSL
jgi:hypothetical protein